MNEWISVKDRLPKEGVKVLACYKGAYLEICKCSEGVWVNRFGSDYTGVTHWMPLPEPPKENEE